MKHNFKKIFAILIFLFCFMNNVLALEIKQDIEIPTWLKLVKEVIDPNQWPTIVSFSYDKKDDINNYQIFYWKTIWNYTNESHVSLDNPITFPIKWVKWDTFYFVIQSRKLWRWAWKSNFSKPLKVVIWWIQNTVIEEKITEPDPIVTSDNYSDYIKKDRPIYTATKLPVTWPENLFLFLIAWLISIFIFVRQKKLN